MKFKMKKWAVLSLAAIMMLSFAACGSENDDTSSQTSGSVQSSSKAENPFANMETVDLNDNAVNSSAFAENKLTLVNAWNLGCTPCIEEIPALDKLNKTYADKGVAVKGLYYNFGNKLSDKERTEIAEIMAKAKATYPQLLTSEAMAATDELKEMAAFPTTYFVDSEGNIVYTVQGSRSYEDWAALVDEVLEKAANNV